MRDREALFSAFGAAGGDRAILDDRNVAHLVAEGHKILSAREVEGLEVDARETASGIAVRVRVAEGVKISRPIHLCFGIVHPEGLQEIRMEVLLEKNSAASLIAHCLFPEAREVKHVMEAKVEIGEGAEMRYTETHFHGPHGGVEVIPHATVRIGRNGRYYNDFTLTTGRVGKLDIDYAVSAQEGSITELTARVLGRGSDIIQIREAVSLDGENARGLIKTRIALEDEAVAEVTGITEGNANGARGHVDCMELVKDRAVARAFPLVTVTHPGAKVTHEAAIGSVDQKQIETLMAHGLSPEEATEFIIKGILK